MIFGTRRVGIGRDEISDAIDSIFQGDLHDKRVESLANATLGVMGSGSLIVARIGQAMAAARGVETKHAIKQVDRMLSNDGIDVWRAFTYYVPYICGKRRNIVVAMDWTDFDDDDQTTLSLNLVTSHGRATPLLWITVWKEELKDRRNDYEDACLKRIRELIPKDVNVTILADRGFGDHKLFRYLPELGFDFVIRFRGNIQVTAADGETRLAGEWVGKGGRARKLSGARVTAGLCKVGAVVCVHEKGMKDAWCLATSHADATARHITNYYAKRWTIEPSFRDSKDLRFGMGLGATHISEPQRRDRLLLVGAFAVVLLTVLGAAGEHIGMDRHLKSNTSRRRVHSLFRQGCMLFAKIASMRDSCLRLLMERFANMLQSIPVITENFSFV